jgi:hypothetical protein
LLVPFIKLINRVENRFADFDKRRSDFHGTPISESADCNAPAVSFRAFLGSQKSIVGQKGLPRLSSGEITVLRGDHGRPGTAEGIEDDGAAPAAVLDRVGHEVDGFDGRMNF